MPWTVRVACDTIALFHRGNGFRIGDVCALNDEGNAVLAHNGSVDVENRLFIL